MNTIFKFVTVDELARLRENPLFIPIAEYAVLKPEPGEVGSLGGVKWETVNGCLIRTSDDTLDVERLFLSANGLECPDCRAQLQDSHPTAVLYSDPLQKRVHCVACGYRGCRVFVTPNV